MKKLLSVLLAMVLVLSVLAGCGNGGSGESKNEGNANEGNSGNEEKGSDEQGTDDSQTDDGEVYELVMELVTYGYDDPDLDLILEEINAITVPEIGVKVSFLTVPIAEMGSKLGLLVSGGEKIDLVCAGLLTNPQNLVADGLLTPITEYIQSSEVLSSLAEGVLEACTINGEIYAYPAEVNPGRGPKFFYDKSLAEEYNIEMPERINSSEDWENIFSQVKDSGMEQYAITLGNGEAAEHSWGVSFDAFGDNTNVAYGVVLDVENGSEVVNWYATDEYKAQAQMHREWYEKGYCVPDSISNGYAVLDSMSYGSVFGFVSAAGVSLSEAYFSSITGKELGSVPVGDVMITAADVVNFCWGVSATCENPQKVIDFLELIFSNTDLANLMNYGIEGVHYETQEGSQIIVYPEGVDSSTVTYGGFVGSFGDSTKTYHREPLTDEFVATIPEYSASQAKQSRFLGYSFDPSSVTSAVAAVTSVISQYAHSLACGIVDPETTIPEFNAALEAAGMNEIIEENQKQLNEWLANQ